MDTTLNSERVITMFEKFVKDFDKICDEMKSLNHEMAIFKARRDAAKIAGTAANTIGVASAVALCFGPIGWAVAGGVAVGSTILGTSTNLFADAFDNEKTKYCKTKIENLITEFQESFGACRKILTFLAEHIFIYANESKLSFDVAMEIILSKNEGIDIIKSKLNELMTSSQFQDILVGKYTLFPLFLMAMIEDSSIPVALCTATQGFLKIGNCTSFIEKLTSKGAGKMFAKSVVVINVFFQMAEICSTVSETMKNHAACETIDELVKKLEGIRSGFKDILDELRLAREIGLRMNVVNVQLECLKK